MKIESTGPQAPGDVSGSARRWFVNRGLLSPMRLAMRAFPQGSTCSENEQEALCAWRYATPARQSGSWQCLAARVPRQAICTTAAWNFDFICVIYN
ncbi:hypothetical protein DEO72_LG3g729 [Vigna unguiculata]|uniref:Uncharacterized protein n=1 Tax=Vigna unguiculata TaxID=3917 RepID=A0A4D6LCD3_VIGUN|nr:hypothetical protein DEO72_LG3g728 [Vigna unguiculata]QCD86208.1 hypothetical protein DEO72_LG3g729 [Vigna unguiculata]